MRRMRMTTLALAVAVLAGCAGARPISGKMTRGDETLTGSISGSGYRGGTGELTLVSSTRHVCKGTFVYTSARRGEGVLNCDDGRTGAFHVAGVAGVGSGSGDIAGQRFTFTFDEAH